MHTAQFSPSFLLNMGTKVTMNSNIREWYTLVNIRFGTTLNSNTRTVCWGALMLGVAVKQVDI